MAQEIQHKGYRLEAQSYEGDNGKWIPYVIITPVDESQNKEMPMSWEREFETQQEADDFGLDGAQFYVDNHF